MYAKAIVAITLFGAISVALAAHPLSDFALNHLTKVVGYDKSASLEEKCHLVIMNLRDDIEDAKRQPYETLISMVIDDLEARPTLVLFYGSRDSLLALLKECVAHPDYDVAATLKEAEVDDAKASLFANSLSLSRRNNPDKVCENFVLRAEYIISQTDDLITPKEYMSKIVDYLQSKGRNYLLFYGESEDLAKEMKACL